MSEKHDTEYIAFGAQSVIVSERLCEALDLRAGQKVLDIATGHGNTAIAAARRHCDVTAIDINPALLALAAKRAAAEHVPITFEEGNADYLPYPDASFDVAMSTFGVIDVYNRRAVNEALRVLRPGGKIGLANWAPRGAYPVEDVLLDGSNIPDDSNPPTQNWMKPGRHRELLGDRVTGLRIAHQTVYYYHTSVGAYVDILLPMLSVEDTLRERARKYLLASFERLNMSGDDTLKLPYHYLQVVATKR